jgi:hypothetical protein
MFDNEPRIVGTQPVRHGSAQEGSEFVCHGIRRISKNELIGAFPSVWPIKKVLDLAGVNRHMISNSTIHDISAQQFQRLSLRFHAGHVRRTSTQRFNADGACSCIKIKKMAIQQPISDDGEECFSHAIGRWTKR